MRRSPRSRSRSRVTGRPVDARRPAWRRASAASSRLAREFPRGARRGPARGAGRHHRLVRGRDRGSDGRDAHRHVRRPRRDRRRSSSASHESRRHGCRRDLARPAAGGEGRFLRVAQPGAHAGARRHSRFPPWPPLHRGRGRAGILQPVRSGQPRGAGRPRLSRSPQRADGMDETRRAVVPQCGALDLPGGVHRAASAAAARC